MNTLPGLASKGEKGKSKYQSLNINNLYRVSRGESLEQHQQKNTLPRKHGMQSLGKVPSARRPPANLPSLKSEHSGNDAAVSLVPSGGPGWGKQDNVTSTTSATTTTSPTSTTTGTNTSNTNNNSMTVAPNATQTPGPPQSAATVVAVATAAATVAVAASVVTNTISPNKQQMTTAVSPSTAGQQPPPTAASLVVGSDKSWSAVMTGSDMSGQHPPPYHSAQFQHEFPSLAGDNTSAGGGGSVPRGSGSDIQYGPGPSLRPQTEGSWIQGGSRTVVASSGGDGTGVGVGVASKANSVQLTGPPQLLGPAGPTPQPVAGNTVASTAHQHMMQFRGVVPGFMFRGNFPANANGHATVSNFSAMTNPLVGRNRFPTPASGSYTNDMRPAARPTNNQLSPDLEEVTPRPIIKEEDLNRMDDMTRDVGWASHDDIDYNQKLAFSDDELPPEPQSTKKDTDRSESNVNQTSSFVESRTSNSVREWGVSRSINSGNSQPVTSSQTGRNAQGSRPIEDDEVWNQRRRQHLESIAIVVERAKLRKEEEEKRFMESKQAAAKKLQKLEEKLKEKKGAEIKENEEGQGTINPSSVPPQPITPVPIPVPEWERERERDRDVRDRERSHTPNDNSENKSQSHNRETDFRQLTQIEGRNFMNKNSRSSEREISRERDCRNDRDRDRETRDREGPFSRHFQSNLPPRFQKQQAYRGSGSANSSSSNISGGVSGGANSSSPQPQTGPQQPPASNISFAQQYDPRWIQTNSSFAGKNAAARPKNRSETESSFERDRDDDRRDIRRNDRHTPDDRDRPYSDSIRKISGSSNDTRYYDDYRYKRENSQEYDFKRDRERDEDKWEKERDRHYDEQKESVKKSTNQHDLFDEQELTRHESNMEWHRDKYLKDGWEERSSQDRHREEASQRPESRDSRISKESNRDSDYTGNWADSPYEPPFIEEKKKDSYREERRQVPGPITKEKIEADDLKSEKRHLIQLKRNFGNSNDKTDKKTDDKMTVEKKSMDDAWVIKKKDNTLERDNSNTSKAWSDANTANISSESAKFMEGLEKNSKKTSNVDISHKSDSKNFDIKKLDKESIDTKEKEEKHSQGSLSRNRSERSHRSNQWSGSYAVYHGSGWSKRSSELRNSGGRGSRNVGSHRNRDWHGTDSELSADEISVSTESGKEDRSGRHSQTQSQRSPKPIKKSDKDEKNKDKQEKVIDRSKFEKRPFEQISSRSNRDSFVPRGEPSRHGRGGGFRGSRSVTSKRIDGYGIPPSKSPFGNQHEDKDKKLSGDEIGGEVVSSDEKTKLNQQQCTNAGVIGSSRNQSKNESQTRGQRKNEAEKNDNNKNRAHSDSRRQKSKNKILNSEHGEECWETTSDNSDTENERKEKGRKKLSNRNNPGPFSGISRQSQNSICSNSGSIRSSNVSSNRNLSDKRGGIFSQHSNIRQNSNSNLRSNQKKDSNKDDIKNDSTINDGTKSNKDIKNDLSDNVNNQDDLGNDDKSHFDTDGFQEVRSKKTVKERQKIEEKTSSRTNKSEKEMSNRGSRDKSKGITPTSQLTPQQIANIPPLLGTPVNPPTMLNTGNNKMSFERQRQNKLPPRFAKQRENNRLQKTHMQQGICDVNEMNKINQSVTMYTMKDNSAPAPVPVVNAWDKPITSQLRNNLEQDSLLPMSVDNCTDIEQTQQSSTSSQRSSPSTDKVLSKVNVTQDKAVLDGTTPPVNTIIFENTNYKSAPVASDLAVKAKFSSHLKTQSRTEKSRKLEENDVESSVISGFSKPITDILNKNETKPEPIQMPLSFNKAEDNADMKLDFTFDSDLSQLTEDKSTKSLGLPRSMHAISSAQSTTISPSTAELNLKIASVKKVWETMPTVLEHTVGQDDNVTNNAGSFSSSFGPDPNSLDHSNAFSKGTDTPDDNHEGYSSSPNQSCTSNNTTNVCKVKPTQQLTGNGQTVHSVNAHHPASQQHSGSSAPGQQSAIVGQNLISHALSPPPMQQILGASVGLGQPPQFTSSQHINYQASMGGNAQYGSMSAIPSPPTVLFNSTQQMPTQGGLYGAFQIDQSQVLNTQGRSQYSQYPNPYNLGQTASSPYSAQSMYLQTAPPHPPPSAQPPPDLYQSLSSQYRMAATGPFGQSQQLTNNPSTVLISSTSNSHSLMSATVKPSSQQISAIGTKAGAQAYQQQSQQGQQLYIPYDPNMQANYLSGTGVLQRGPTGPVQNSVVPGLQPSSSYYSGSAGAQTGFYQQPGNSTLQSAPLHQHQTSFGLQGNVFGTHNQSHANAAGLQNFSSQFLSSPMQMAAAAALSAQQQFRSPSLPNPNYLKNVGTQHMNDQSSRSQQLKSPSANQQDVLASVFNSAPQIPSPKSRQNCKQPPPQSSPTQHKYVSNYQSVNNQQSAQMPQTRYPTPIQRPVNFQPSLNSSLQNSGNVSNRHRPTHNQNSRGGPQRQYYSGQGSGMATSQTEHKNDDGKLNENGPTKMVAAGNGNPGTNSEMNKDSVVKDDTIVNKE